MKQYKFLFVWFMLISCTATETNRNPYLNELNFSYPININLPLYNKLKTPLNPVYINVPGVGNKGVYVINTGGNNYTAWEAACPNHNVSSCEAMSVSGGINLQCVCDNTIYSLISGVIIKSENNQPQYPLLNYRVSVSGNVVTVYN